MSVAQLMIIITITINYNNRFLCDWKDIFFLLLLFSPTKRCATCVPALVAKTRRLRAHTVICRPRVWVGETRGKRWPSSRPVSRRFRLISFLFPSSIRPLFGGGDYDDDDDVEKAEISTVATLQGSRPLSAASVAAATRVGERCLWHGVEQPQTAINSTLLRDCHFDHFSNAFPLPPLLS